MSQTTNTCPSCERELDDLKTDPDAAAAALEPARHPFIAWAIASLRIIWSSLRHPGQPVWIDYRTGKVWLQRDD